MLPLSLSSYPTQSSLEYLEAMVGKYSVGNHLPSKAQMIVLGNMADCRPEEREVDEADGQAFADLLGVPYLETSAVTGQNLTRMLYLMTTSIMLGSKRRSGPKGRPASGGLQSPSRHMGAEGVSDLLVLEEEKESESESEGETESDSDQGWSRRSKTRRADGGHFKSLPTDDHWESPLDGSASPVVSPRC
ncbi:unnamed protein product [Chrysoparadoxa australica]